VALWTTMGFALIVVIVLLAFYLVTRSPTLFAACCVPAGFAFSLLLVAGLFGFLKKRPFRGDLL